LSNITPLLDRNRRLAADPSARQGMPRLPFIPNLNLYIVTRIDPRVDPAQILGVKLGEAIVERDIGGRITPVPPDDWPAMVTLSGSPPNSRMLLCTQRRAACWSIRPPPPRSDRRRAVPVTGHPPSG
jgi:hypothetical protein